MVRCVVSQPETCSHRRTQFALASCPRTEAGECDRNNGPDQRVENALLIEPQPSPRLKQVEEEEQHQE